MANLIEYWRDIAPGSPNDTVTRYMIDTDTDTYPAPDVFSSLSGVLGPVHPVVGTVIFTKCQGPDFKQYKGTGSSASVNIVTTPNSPSCCDLSGYTFSIVRTNNTDLLTPNGTINITATIGDINDFQASIDGGTTWQSPIASAILFENLPAGTYSVILKQAVGVCSTASVVTINDVITYPPLLISESYLPNLYMPVFFPIRIGFQLDNNTAIVKTDGQTYLEPSTTDAKEYLATLPIIKILGNEDYGGTWQITGVDDPSDPQKFYFDALYTSDQAIAFVPFDKQVFQLFCESAFNVFQKIADINIYPDASGEYQVRVEGFLQAAFKILPPVNNGDEITLLRKYYVAPRDFDESAAPTILNAVYSAVPDLTPFLGAVVPLGPAPINFINEISSLGYPVLFSYIDMATGRVKNVTSSEITTIVATTPIVYVNALSLNVYEVTWVNPAGAIGTLNVTPVLPSWITLLPSAPDTVKLRIDTDTVGVDGDYDGSDYDAEDYLVASVNAIIGCYSFAFTDGATPLFDLELCIFPIQSANGICKDGFNIAWINREGGWSSYIFDGRKTYGKEVGDVKTFKSGNRLKRLSVENVYDVVEVSISNKSDRDLRFIASLRQSIEAYLWSESTKSWSIPIILNKESFAVYSMPFKQINVADKFTFRYSEEVIIQSQ